MANYITTTSELTAVADAIRAKSGTVSTMSYPDGFVSTISAIEVGGGGIDISAGVIPGGFVADNGTVGGVYPTASLYYPTIATVKLNNGSDFQCMGGVFDCGNNLEGYWKELQTVSLDITNGTLTHIPDYAFRACEKLQNPSSWLANTNYIAPYAFQYVGHMYTADQGTWDLVLPNIKQVGTQAFRYCKKIRSITIGTYGNSNLESIGSQAFRDEGYCTTVNILETPSSSIASNAFSNGVTTINVVWSEGDVANAPWGPANATINYDYNPNA